MEEGIIEKSGYNYGFALLRMLMCFEVVLDHFWAQQNLPVFLLPFAWLGGLAVPVFMFLSFYLTEKIFLDSDKNKIKKRLWRVAYPHVGWAAIYWLVYAIGQVLFKDIGVRFTDFLWQLFLGHSPKLNAAMWFQINLLILTLVFTIIFRLLQVQKGVFALYILLLVAFVSQYSGANFAFCDTLRYEVKYPLGRFSEMIPYAVLGFICAYYGVFEKLKKNRLQTGIVCFLSSGFLLKYHIITDAPGFGYSRTICIPISFCIIAFAYILPLEKLSEKWRNGIRFMTKYTLGIYSMHMIIGRTLTSLVAKLDVQIPTFILCMTIYSIGFLVSFVLCKIPTKYTRQLVD